MREDVCERVGVEPIEAKPFSKAGVAIHTLSLRPIHGLRHQVGGGTSGWYIWCGEYSEDDDFFQPLHVDHLRDRLPQVLAYLSLPPGYRFLIDDAGYEDIWYDDSLLQV
jgi:hypothetical protein